MKWKTLKSKTVDDFCNRVNKTPQDILSFYEVKNEKI